MQLFYLTRLVYAATGSRKDMDEMLVKSSVTLHIVVVASPRLGGFGEKVGPFILRMRSFFLFLFLFEWRLARAY